MEQSIEREDGCLDQRTESFPGKTASAGRREKSAILVQMGKKVVREFCKM